MTDYTYEQALNMDHMMSHAQFNTMLFPEIMTLTAPQGNEMVLDVGTGSGQFAHALAHKVTEGTIIGIDDSDSMLRVGREKATKDNLFNYYPLKASAEDLLFRDSIFDLAFCVRALHHFDAPGKGLREIGRVLKKDGHLMLCEPLGPKDEKLRAALTEAFQAVHPDHKFFSPEMIDEMLLSAGFQEIRGTEVALAFHQEGIGGVPMGPHYMEAYHMIRMRQDKDLLDRFNEQVLQVSEGPGGKIFIHGELKFLVSLQEKRQLGTKKAAKSKK